jgi:hypothetical protein
MNLELNEHGTKTKPTVLELSAEPALMPAARTTLVLSVV